MWKAFFVSCISTLFFDVIEQTNYTQVLLRTPKNMLIDERETCENRNDVHFILKFRVIDFLSRNEQKKKAFPAESLMKSISITESILSGSTWFTYSLMPMETTLRKKL